MGNARTRVQVLEGVRVLACLWVVLFHAYGFFPTALAPEAVGHFISKDGSVLWQGMFAKGYYGVDLFMLIGGFLSASSWNQLNKSREVPEETGWQTLFLDIPRSIFRKWCRLAPLQYVVVLLHLLIPDESQIQSKYLSWTAFLFIQNFWRTDQQLIGPLWSNSVDLQVAALLPIAFHVASRGFWTTSKGPTLDQKQQKEVQNSKKATRPAVMAWRLLLVAALLVGFSGLRLAHLVWGPAQFRFPLKFQNVQQGGASLPSKVHLYLNHFYFDTLARLPAYLVGAALFFALEDPDLLKQRSGAVDAGLLAAALGGWWWCITVPSIGYFTRPDYSPAFTLLFGALEHTVFPLANAILLYFCLRQGWSVSSSDTVPSRGQPWGIPTLKKFLEWRFWTSIARLTYAIYLVHSTILNNVNAVVRKDLSYLAGAPLPAAINVTATNATTDAVAGVPLLSFLGSLGGGQAWPGLLPAIGLGTFAISLLAGYVLTEGEKLFQQIWNGHNQIGGVEKIKTQ